MRKNNQNDECLICFDKKYKTAYLPDFLIQSDNICQKCRNGFAKDKNTINHEGLLIEHLYDYNDYFSQLLIQYKELNDEALAPVFIKPYLSYLKNKYRGYELVPVPSRKAKKEARGFDHIKLIFAELNLSYSEIFENNAMYDQKGKSLIERQAIKDHIKLSSFNLSRDSKILIVDDLITTKATMFACYQLIKNDYKCIKGLAVAYQKNKERE
ncbi:MAG: hypothetical protein VB009_04980 [Erysipelotrichaceae bacterium]|nr:hypothetical protein [Erysipelotrichaceae bacterium]